MAMFAIPLKQLQGFRQGADPHYLHTNNRLFGQVTLGHYGPTETMFNRLLQSLLT